MTTSLEPFNRLVRLVARVFYDDTTMKGDNQPKNRRGDNRGMAVVVLDALTKRQWAREEDLAKDLKMHSKQLRRILRFFEEEKLVARDHRKETVKSVKEGEEKTKLHTHSYCCLDYAQIYDVVRYRIHRMKKKLKEELDSRNTVQEYVCPNCGRRYSAFDALELVSFGDECFHCEICNGEVVAEERGNAGDDDARLKDMLRKMGEQLKPLVEQIHRVKDLVVPELGSLRAWEAFARANGDLNADDSSKSFLGETKVEVALSGAGVEAKEEITESENELATPMKVLPPWMIKQGMNLTKEQRGDFDDVKSIQDEFLKAYYAAMLKRKEDKRKEEQAAASNQTQAGVSEAPDDRRVGMKVKRENDEYVLSEKRPHRSGGKTDETFEVADLKVEADAADAAGDEEDDDVDWEEG